MPKVTVLEALPIYPLVMSPYSLLTRNLLRFKLGAFKVSSNSFNKLWKWKSITFLRNVSILLHQYKASKSRTMLPSSSEWSEDGSSRILRNIGNLRHYKVPKSRNMLPPSWEGSEDGSSSVLRNVGNLSHYKVPKSRTMLPPSSGWSEAGGSKVFWNICIFPHRYTASHSKHCNLSFP
jgi:hypothetical protein